MHGKRIALAGVLCAGVSLAGAAAPTLTVRTDNPTNNMFAVGRPASAVFTLAGARPDERRTVVADVCDYRDEKVATLTAEIAADGKGTGSATVALPTARHGFFRVKAKAGDLTLPKCGSRPAGQFTYGVTVDPKDRPRIPQDLAFLGIHGEACGQSLWMGAHQGFATVFDSAEKKADWDARNVIGWEKWGFSPFGVNFWTWAPENFPERLRGWVREHRKSVSLWSAYADPVGREAIAWLLEKKAIDWPRYPTTPGKRVYELFWEPDLTAPDKKTLVEVAKFMSERIKAKDPEALIALPTLSNCTLLSWHRELFELGILKYGDVFDLHPYTAYPPEPNGYLENIRALKRMLAEYGRPDMPFICTESGYQTAATKEGERLQLDGQVRVQLMLLGEGVWFNCPFYGTDYGGDANDHPEGDYGITYNLDYPKHRFGARHISPRPSFLGLCAFSMLLEGYRPRESVECLGETVLGYLYTNRLGRATAAFWDYGGTDANVRLPVGKSVVELADIMGNRFTREAPGGTLELKLSTSPVYVIDPELAAWDRGFASLRAAAAAALRAKEQAPVKMGAVESAFVGTEPAASVTVENNSDRESTLAVSTRIVGEPDARQSVRATLPAHATRAVLVPLKGFRPDPFKTFRLEAAAEDAAGHRAAKTRTLNFLRATYAPGVGTAVAIGDWKGVRRRPAGSSADQSAEIGFGWNEGHLLVDALVTDDAYRQDGTGWRTWNGDAIQFGFAKRRLERLTANDYTDMLEQGTTEIDFALTKNGPEGYRTISFDPYRWPTDVHGLGQIDLKECKLSIEKSDLSDGRVALRYRIALPWRYMHKEAPARAGESVFVSATFNDRDPGDTWYVAIPLFDLKRMPPRHFGSVYLSDGRD